MIVATAAAFAFGGTAVAQQQAATPQPVTRAAFVAQLAKELAALQAQAREKLQADFKQLDTNKDGQLSFAEFSAVMAVKPSQTPAQILAGLDANKDGKVSAAEFKSAPLGRFDKVDANHDGTVTPAEVQRAGGAK